MNHRIAIIGFGAIASELVQQLQLRPATAGNLAVVLRPGSPRAGSVPRDVSTLTTFEELQKFAPDLVVEAAGHEAVGEYAEPCLRAGWSFLMASVGVLAHAGRYQALCEAARAGQCKLIVPAGAVASLDYLRAIAQVKDVQVLYESRKTPAAWMDELQKQSIALPLKEPMVLFEGDAQEAASRYPQNLNVAASLALAGVGFEKTRVRIVTDPAAMGNTHRLEVSGAFGTLSTHIVNRPSPANPKTSWVVGLSLLASIDSYFSPVVFG